MARYVILELFRAIFWNKMITYYNVEVFMEKKLQKKRPEDNTDRRDPKGKKKDASLTVVLFSALALVLCMMLEIYLMIFMPEMLPAIAVAGLAALGCTYLYVATLVNGSRKRKLSSRSSMQVS